VGALGDDDISGSEQRRDLLQSRYGHSVMLPPLKINMKLQEIYKNNKKLIDVNKACPQCFCKIQVFTCTETYA